MSRFFSSSKTILKFASRNLLSSNCTCIRQFYSRSKNSRDVIRILLAIRRSNIHSNSSRILFASDDDEKNYEKKPKKKKAPNQKQSDQDDEDEKQKRNLRMMAQFFAALTLLSTLTLLLGKEGEPRENDAVFITWNEFVSQILSRGEVRRITVRPETHIATIYLHDNAVISGRKAERERFYMHLGSNTSDIEAFEEQLRDAEKKLKIDPKDAIPLQYVREYPADWILLFSVIALSLIMYKMYASPGKSGGGTFGMPNPFQSFSQAKFTLIEPAQAENHVGTKLALTDVAGMKEAKQEVMEFIDFLRYPERYTRLGAKIPKGALLLGPPGCGKTLLAKAVASEANVPFLSMNGSEFVEMIGGLGAARVRDLFKQARTRAPCIIYIDEIDAVGRQRGSGGPTAGATGEEEQTLNQLLVEMDGIGTQEGVLLLASTNRPDILDRALLRPGRFDRHVTIELPTPIERKEIFDLYLAKIKSKADLDTISKKLASMTTGMSGADIFNVVNEAALHAATNGKKLVEQIDFELALDKVFRGSEKKQSSISPKEKRMRAYYLAGQCLAGWMLEDCDALMRVSVKPRTKGFGFAQHVAVERKLFSREQLKDKMSLALAGRAAEIQVFNHMSTDSESDLRKVTDIAYKFVRLFGMSSKVGNLSFGRDTEEGSFVTKPYSKSMAHLIDREASKLINECYQKVQDIIEKNKEKLELLAKELQVRETLSYSEVEEILGPSPFGKKALIESIDWEWQSDKPVEKPDEGDKQN